MFDSSVPAMTQASQRTSDCSKDLEIFLHEITCSAENRVKIAVNHVIVVLLDF